MNDDLKRAPIDNALAERLFRRVAMPIGVIDGRHPQGIHERTVGWIAARFQWMDHWKSRYGAGETPPGPPGKDQLVFADPVTGVGGVDPGNRVTSSMAPSFAAPPSSSVPDTSPSLLRVSRRAAHSAPTMATAGPPHGL